MDKELLKVLRKIYSLDTESLPDDITTDALGKVISDQVGKFVKPEDFKKLQQKLTDNDVKLKEALKNKKEKPKDDDKDDNVSKILDEQNKKIDELTKVISDQNSSKRKETLSEKYPDISAELLSALPDDKIDEVVKAQRAIAKKHYKGAEIFTKPHYETSDDVDKALKNIQEDKNLSGVEKTAKIIELNRVKSELKVEV